jgi:hypothetical protein
MDVRRFAAAREVNHGERSSGNSGWQRFAFWAPGSVLAPGGSKTEPDSALASQRNSRKSLAVGGTDSAPRVTAQGNIDWSVQDIYVNAALARGLKIHTMFYGVPAWSNNTAGCDFWSQNCSAKPGNADHFYDFVHAIAERYGSAITTLRQLRVKIHLLRSARQRGFKPGSDKRER